MKFSSLVKRFTAIALVLIIVVALLPTAALNTITFGADNNYYAVYNPYEQLMGKTAGMNFTDWAEVDYSGLDFSVSGCYYSSTPVPFSLTFKDNSDNLYICELNDSEQNNRKNNCTFLGSKSYNNAIGSRQASNGGGGKIKLTFTAPEAATYKIIPLEITGTGGKSMLLTNPQETDIFPTENFTQSFTVMQGTNLVFSKSLTLNNYADATADIDDNITVNLAKGEELCFYFESSSDWGKSNLYVNFEIALTEYSSDSVKDVYFEKSNYITSMSQSINIAPVIVPATAANQKVTYSVENESVLTVKEDGTVEPKKAGYTKVTVTTEDGGFDAETTVAVYADDATIYKVKPLYDAAAEKIGSVTVTTTEDNDINSAWQALYHNGSEYVKCEKVTREPWGSVNFGIKFHCADGNFGGISQYVSGGVFKNEIVYGRQDARQNGAALLFTAPEYGFYSLITEDGLVKLADNTVSYMNSDSNAALSELTVNVYLNDGRIHTQTLTKDLTEAEFPVLNKLEMNAGDTLRIELETGIWEKGAVNIYPQMIKVLSEKPVIPTTGITLSDSAVTLTKQGTHTLVATILPVNATDKEVVFTSSDNNVATVSENGVITAVGLGTAVITAKSKSYNQFFKECTVTVTGDKLNFINTVWPATRDAITEENKLNEYTIGSQFTAGALTDGIYKDFKYALKNDWGNPRAVLFTSDESESGSNTSKQSLNIYDGVASVCSYVDNSWVYIGYTADADGEYTLSGSDVTKAISLKLGKNKTVENLISWGQDQPFYVRITKNGETIWPQNNAGGYELKPSTVQSVEIPTIKDLKLYKGDTVRIEISGQSKITDRNVIVLVDFDITMTKAITPEIPVTNVTMSDTAHELSIGESYQLTASVVPENANNKNIKWISSDSTTVKVDENGKITSIKQGEAIIYAVSMENGDIKAQCNVTVSSFKAETLNFINTVWPATRDAITEENKLNEYTISSQFTAGTLTDGFYEDFKYALKNDWGNPRAVLFTSDEEEKGSNTSKQSLNIYDGVASVCSYVDNSWVYIGYTADADGEYTLSGSDVTKAISLKLGKNKTVENLISWGQDQPIYVRITKNGETIWPQNNAGGYELKPSTVQSVEIPTIKGLKLYKGDTVRIEILGQSKITDRNVTVMVDFDITMTKAISVGTPVTSISISNSEYQLPIGESYQLSASVIPQNANNQNIKWTSSDSNIVSVDANGKITSLKSGKATVYAISVENPDIKAGCSVEVSSFKVEKHNFVKTVWPATRDAITEENKLNEYTISSQFTAGTLTDGFYEDFKYALKNDWGNPRAVLFTSDEEEKGSNTSKQSLNIYDGLASVCSYVDNSWVYIGYTADADGEYTLSGSDVTKAISLKLGKNKTVENLKSWGQDQPIYVRITKNGETIWPQNNAGGYELKPSTVQSVEIPTIKGLKLYKGDTVRIEISGQGKITDRNVTVLADFDITMTKAIAVEVPVTSISLSDTEYQLPIAASYRLRATVAPSNASNKNVAWISSDPTTVKVDANGKITALKAGNAIITAISVENNSIKAQCNVNVASFRSERLNFINEVWPDARNAITEENKLTSYTIESQFVAGSLSDGVYTDFEYALKNNWGNPKAVLFTNDTNEKGSNTSKQSISIYDGKASIGSYTADSWVYIGYKADDDGLYTFSASEACKSISLGIASYCTVEEIINWGEDHPFYVRITKNGETIWPLNNAGSYELKPGATMSVDIPTLEGIKMYKGDTLRVEVLGQSKIPSRHVTVLADFDVIMTKQIAIETPVKSVSISESKCELSIGVSHQLKATVAPANASNKNIKWVSSDPDTVKVNSNGKLTSLKQGNATVYAISEENNAIKAKCDVTVTSFRVINYTPDELKASLDKQLNGQVVVSSMPVDLDTNWSAQTRKTTKDEWETLEALTTYDWKNTGKPASYAFAYASQTSVGMESVSGYHTPYVATAQPQMAMVFTATRAGTYTISPDIRNASIYLPGTYVNGRIEEKDREKEYKFSIEVNGKEIYAVNVSAVKNSFAFPTIEDIFLSARDTVRFIITDNAESSSPIYVYFSPVISLIKPDSVDHAPFADDCEFILEPDKVFKTKLKSVHPNGREIMYEILDSNSNTTLEISDNGDITYTPKTGYKGIDVRRVRMYDSIGKESIVTLTFMVANKYDAVEAMSAVLLASDPVLDDDGAKGVDWADSVWKFQYTYDGLTYSNGAPKYYDTDSVEVIKNPGWWGYNTYSDKMPQACITDVNGVAAIRVMAGHSPWGKNATGGITFIAPGNGTYLLRGNELFDKILLAADLEKDTFQNPMNVWITKNGKKIWPVEESSVQLTRDITEADFPTIKVAMQAGDTLRVCISGNDYNERQNLVAVAPTVYDIGSYDSRLDPNPETEGGAIITDDDGEPMVKYDKYSVSTGKLSALKGNYSEPIVKKGYTVDKIRKIKQTAPFAFEISYQSCEEAVGYTINVYRITEDGCVLYCAVDSKELKAEITDLEEGKYWVQVLAVDEYGQYIEVYTARELSVDASGNISAKNPVNILMIIIIAAAVLLTAGFAVVIVIIIQKRKLGVKSEKGSIS